MACPFETQVPLAKHCTLHVGPLVPRLYFPEDTAQVQELMRVQAARFWIGNGSNVLFLPALANEHMVKLGKNLSQHHFSGSSLWAQAGAMLPRLLNEACERGLSGLEMCTGVPASVGGAVAMNFGAYQQELSQFVTTVTAVDPSGAVQTLTREQCQFSYRSSIFQRGAWCVTEVVFELVPTESARVAAAIEANQLRRKKITPPYPNTGSVFKNPPGQVTGRIIEELGLRAYRVGDAAVWKDHGNYLVNLGAASPQDCLAVIEHVEREVLDQRGIKLEREIRVLG